MSAEHQSHNARVLESFTLHMRAVHRFLVRSLSNPSDASDLAQEVWLRLLRRGNLEGVDDPKAFLMRIAGNVLAEWRRATALRSKYMTTDSEIFEASSEQLSAQEVADCLALDRLERALGMLPAHQCDVLLLVRRDGYSCAEVADRLNLNVHTVRKYLERAKGRVRRLLPRL